MEPKNFNKVPAIARNVRLTVKEDNTVISKSWIDEKFPMSEMEPGASVDISAVVTMSSKSKEPVYLSWADVNGNERNKTVEITL